MASIDLNKLQPGKTYNVSVRALDADGNYSGYSVVYSFTTPTTVNGKQLTSINSTVVTGFYSASSSGSPVGGALTAGGLDENGLQNAGGLNLANVWNTGSAGYTGNASVTGTASAGAVIINSTGIMGYQFGSASVGQPSFFLNTYDGNAYFRGTIYAGAGLIGGWTIGDTSLSGGKTSTNLLASFDPSADMGNLENYWTASYTSITDTSNSVSVGQSTNGYLDPYGFTLYVDEQSQSGSIVNPVSLMYKSASAFTRFSASDLSLTSNGNYTFSAYCKLNEDTSFGSSSVVLKVERYSASTGGTLLGTASSTAIPLTSTSSWTRASISFSASTTDYFRFSILEPKTLGWSYSSPYSVPFFTTSIEFDKIQLELGSSPTDYIGPGGALTLSTVSSSPVISIFSDAPGGRSQTLSMELTGAQTGTSLTLSSGLSVGDDLTVYGISRLKRNVALGTSGGGNTIYSYGNHYFKELTTFSKKATFVADVSLGNSSTDTISMNGYVRTPIINYYTGNNALLIQSGTGINMVNVNTNSKYVQINNSLRTTEELAVLGSISYTGSLVNASSKKFKKNINVFSVPESILNINPVTFMYDETKTQVADSNLGKLNLGFIAEDFEDNGVSEVVIYNEDGTVQGLDYSKIAVILLPLIKQQKDKIDKLEQRLALLENK